MRRSEAFTDVLVFQVSSPDPVAKFNQTGHLHEDVQSTMSQKHSCAQVLNCNTAGTRSVIASYACYFGECLWITHLASPESSS